VQTAAIKEQAETLRVSLMRTESEVYGDFHTLRTFHNDLFQSISRNDASPYPALDTLFKQLFTEANLTVGTRVNYDTVYWRLRQATDGKEKVVLNNSFASIQRQFQQLPDSLTRYQQSHRNGYFELRKAYQDTCRASGIVRYTPQDYAAILDVKLTQWQDSLEECGRLVAACKMDLKQRFPSQKAGVCPGFGFGGNAEKLRIYSQSIAKLDIAFRGRKQPRFRLLRSIHPTAIRSCRQR